MSLPLKNSSTWVRKNIPGPHCGEPTDRHSMVKHKSGFEGPNLASLAAVMRYELEVDGGINIISEVSEFKDMTCCQFSENKDRIGIGFVDGSVYVVGAESKQLIHEFVDPSLAQTESDVTAIKSRPSSPGHPNTDSFTCSYLNGCIKTWNYLYGTCTYTIFEKRRIFGFTYHPKFPKICTYGDDAFINIYDEETKIQERIFGPRETPAYDGHLSKVHSACFHPKRNFEFVSGGLDNVVLFWDMRLPTAFRYILGPKIYGDAIHISRNGKEVLTCTWNPDRQLLIWDYGSGKLIQNIHLPDKSNLNCGKFLNQNYLVYGGGHSNILQLYDLKNQKVVGTVTGLENPGVTCLDIGPTKKESDEEIKLPQVIFCSGKTLYEIEFYGL